VAIGIIFLIMGLSYILSKIMSKINKKILDAKDDRMKTTS